MSAEAKRPEHSYRGASAMSRWRPCPGSVKLTEKQAAAGELKDDTSWEAAEGSAAHHFAALALAGEQDAWEYAGEERHEADWDFVVNDEMVSGIQLYLDTVRADYEEGQQMYVEHVVGMLDVHEGIYGTLDAGIIGGSLLRIYDFKYGKGLRVEPEENDQLIYYAACLFHELSGEYPEVEEVELVIVQPRIEHPQGPVRRWTLTVQALGEWVEAILIPAIRRTEGELEPTDFKDGDQCRFCPVSAACPLRRERAITLFEDLKEDGVPDERGIAALENWELAEQMALKGQVMGYFSDLAEEAFRRAMRGEKVPGNKLVEQTRNRVYKDGAEVEAKKQFKAKAFTSKMKSPAQIEKLGKAGKEFAAEWAFKPEGGFTLVPISDKKKEVEVQQIDPNVAFAGL